MIELLAVLGVLAVIMAFLLPLGQGARHQYSVVETKARFSRYTLALEQFKFEYGVYPYGGASPIIINDPPGRFFELMTGRAINGGDIGDPVALLQNRDKLAFLQFYPNELTPDGLIQDPFGQTDITLYFDTDGDGFLNGVENVRAKVGWKSTGSAGDFYSWKTNND